MHTSVPGIAAAVDGIRFYGDLTALRAFAAGGAHAAGVLDSVTCTSIAGWAWDPSDRTKSTSVKLSFDGALGTAGATAVSYPAAGERPDLAVAALRAVRKTAELAEIPAIVAVSPRQIARIDPASGFDDFIVLPCVPSELYARIRQLEWRRSEFATEERTKVGRLIVDRAGHEVLVDGRAIILTAKEFALLAFLAQNRGRVFSREELLEQVWDMRGDINTRTVDVHVRRLRISLATAADVIETVHGFGYRAKRD